ncbi:MAG: GntR family transcriptional regulator [Pseudomonadota bacterium]
MLKNAAQEGMLGAVKQPAHQSVYEGLRDQILFGELAPGQPVTIQGLTQQLGAGMTPVREALRRLIANGALVMLGNRRVCVPVLTESCIKELDFMRKSLEPQLARWASTKMNPQHLMILGSHDDALNAAIAGGDIHNYLLENYQFHAALYTIADAPIVAATVDRLWLRFGPSLRVVCGRYGTMNLPDKHADLLRALADGNADAAERAIKEDIEQGMTQIRAALSDAQPHGRFD